MYNQIEDSWNLSNKKALYINMKNYYENMGEDPFQHMPVTYHVKKGVEDPEFVKFAEFFGQTQIHLQQASGASIESGEETKNPK
jgi:tubulin--tyrosine ligase